MPDRVYIACDLKSFYVLMECIERGLAPPHHQPGGGGQEPDGKDHLSGGLPTP